jgi:hypothetical protein
MMSSEQHGLPRAEYMRLRDRFLPEHRVSMHEFNCCRDGAAHRLAVLQQLQRARQSPDR